MPPNKMELLLGLLREVDGKGGHVLRDAGLGYEQVAQAVPAFPQPFRGTTLDLSDDTKRVLELATETVRERSQLYIGTEHLLMGILKYPECRAFELLQRFNIEPEDLRQQVLKILGESPAQPSPPPKQAAELPPFRKQPSGLIHVIESKSFEIIQGTIAKILAMVGEGKLTSEQAIELMTGFQPYLAPSTGQKAELIAQSLGAVDMEKRKLHIVIRNIATRDIVYETTTPFRQAMDNLDTLVLAATQDYNGWFWAENVDATNRLEIRIEEDNA